MTGYLTFLYKVNFQYSVKKRNEAIEILELTEILIRCILFGCSLYLSQSLLKVTVALILNYWDYIHADCIPFLVLTSIC